MYRASRTYERPSIFDFESYIIASDIAPSKAKVVREFSVGGGAEITCFVGMSKLSKTSVLLSCAKSAPGFLGKNPY